MPRGVRISQVQGEVNGQRYPTPSRKLTADDLARVTTLVERRIGQVPLSGGHWDDGMVWYAEANSFGRKVAATYGLRVEQVTWMTALLSPLNNWEQNKRDVFDLIETGNCGALPLGTARALSVLEGGDGAVIAGGRKVRAFGRNITYPWNSLDVTIDTHMVQVLNLPGGGWLRRKGTYGAVADAFRNVADGLGVMPHQLQAAVWLYQR